MTELEIREFEVRLAQEPDKREFTGIAVPWDTVASIGGLYTERVARGAVVDSEDAKVWWRHSEPIGRITNAEDTEAGWQITGVLSRTARGDEAYTLLRDGVVDRLSIGFEPMEHTEENHDDGSLTVTRTKIRVREVSIVPLPAYSGAAVTQVREARTEGEDPMSDTLTRADLDEVRSTIEDLDREMKVLSSTVTAAPAGQRCDMFRSVGHLLKELASGNDEAIRAYNEAFEVREYAGATSADTILQDAWVGNLTEIIKKRRPVLSTFATGSLPAEGMTVEYAVLKSDTTQVTVQDAEGDDLAYGKVAVELKNAPVITAGGWSELSRQAIERSSIGTLETTWEAMAEKYGQRAEIIARSRLTAALAWDGVGESPAPLAEITADLTSQDGVVAAVLDLAEHFDNVGRSLDGVFLDKTSFLALYGVKADDRILQVTGAPTDKVGTISVRTASGEVSGLQFKLLPNAAGGTVVAYDETAIKTLEAPGAPFRLQDGNIVNLTQAFSLYGYISSFVQKPAGLVKVVDEAESS